MATYTKNYKLKKPAPEDFADIADLNENTDKIDAALKDKADLDESKPAFNEQKEKFKQDMRKLAR